MHGDWKENSLRECGRCSRREKLHCVVKSKHRQGVCTAGLGECRGNCLSFFFLPAVWLATQEAGLELKQVRIMGSYERYRYEY